MNQLASPEAFTPHIDRFKARAAATSLGALMVLSGCADTDRPVFPDTTQEPSSTTIEGATPEKRQSCAPEMVGPTAELLADTQEGIVELANDASASSNPDIKVEQFRSDDRLIYGARRDVVNQSGATIRVKAAAEINRFSNHPKHVHFTRQNMGTPGSNPITPISIYKFSDNRYRVVTKDGQAENATYFGANRDVFGDSCSQEGDVLQPMTNEQLDNVAREALIYLNIIGTGQIPEGDFLAS